MEPRSSELWTREFLVLSSGTLRWGPPIELKILAAQNEQSFYCLWNVSKIYSYWELAAVRLILWLINVIKIIFIIFMQYYLSSSSLGYVIWIWYYDPNPVSMDFFFNKRQNLVSIRFSSLLHPKLRHQNLMVYLNKSNKRKWLQMIYKFELWITFSI